MMRSNILALVSMALAGFFVSTVQADDTTEWFAIFYKDGDNLQFLDSSDSTVATNRQPGISYIESGGDKGLRWKFLSGRGSDGFLATQAHSSHIVGYDGGDNEFHSDFKSSNDDTAVIARFKNDDQVTLCYNDNCIGSGAAKTADGFVWNITQIAGA